jgi:hypothetical protein
MVHTMCHNLGWLKFSVLPAQNFTQEYIIAFLSFLLSSCAFIAQDWKSLIKRCNLCVSTRHATSRDHSFFWLQDNGCKWALMDWADHVSAKKSETRHKSLVRTFLLPYRSYQLFALCSFFSPHYLLGNIVHNFIYHKVTAHAPCCFLAPNLSMYRF